MSDDKKRRRADFSREVGDRERRKLLARKKRTDQVWFGLGMFGLVGWSVAVPMLLGTFLGLWIDLKYPSQYSWTLMLIVIGLLIGCANAWYWVSRERRGITKERENDVS